jgi:hypothetical protein
MRWLLLLCLILLPVARADETKTIDVDKGMAAVKEELGKHKAEFGMVTHVKDEALGKVFPKHIFFTAHFRQYPVARALPEPLRFANVFAYSADGKLALLNEPKTLDKFFKDNVGMTKELDPAKDVVRAWLKLSPELKQDGFFKFVLMDDSTTAEAVTDKKFTVIKAKGVVVVMQGGNGQINATLSFSAGGKLSEIEEINKVRPGPRPICQATKLLDPDPIVRKMAEQDLLIMGRSAKPYLDEQRAKAAPELRQAIDRLWQRILSDDR